MTQGVPIVPEAIELDSNPADPDEDVARIQPEFASASSALGRGPEVRSIV